MTRRYRVAPDFRKEEARAELARLAANPAPAPNVFDFYPARVHNAVAAQTNTEDLSDHLTRAFAESRRLYFPRGRHLIERPVVLAGAGYDLTGAGWDDGVGAQIHCGVRDGAAFEIGSAATASPHLNVSNLCFRGVDHSCDAIRGDHNVLFAAFHRVNFLWLRRAVDATPSFNWYFSSFTQCRFRDLFMGFENVTAEKADEMAWVACSFHNATNVYFRLGLSGISGTFEWGETVTGGTSGETGTVVGVCSDHLIVSKGEGKNPTPLTIGFVVGETLTGGTSLATGTTTEVQGNRSVKINQGDGVSILGCQHNNQGAELADCRELAVHGGYWESYNYDIPALKLTGCSGHVSIYKLPGTYFEADDDSYRQISGRLPGGNRNNLPAQVLHSYRNIFPDPTCSTQEALDALDPANMSKVLGGAGIQFSTTTLTPSRLHFLMDPGIPGAGCLVKIKCNTGSLEVRWENMDTNSGVEVDSAVTTDWVYVRLSTTNSDVDPRLAIKTLRLDGGSMDGEVEYIIVIPAEAIPGQPDLLREVLADQVTANSAVLRPLASEPSSPVAGMLVVADRATWDPLGHATGNPYPVIYDGSGWIST